MNRQIVQLFGLFTLLFALLVGFTSRWTVLEAESLEQNAANRRPLLAEQRIPRGVILARDGSRIATSGRIGSGEAARFQRRYPFGPLFSHPIGYSFVQRGRAGLEKSKNDELTGDRNEFRSIVDQLSGGAPQGDDLVTTLDLKAQRTAVRGLGGRKGSVVAIEPSTGRIRVMVSVPQFDPNDVPERYGALNSDDENAPLLNRATQGRYPPGSTMKVVTAAAAIDSGRFKPDSVLDGGSPREIGGAELENFGGQDYGAITLTEALTNSVNTVWGRSASSSARRRCTTTCSASDSTASPRSTTPPSSSPRAGCSHVGACSTSRRGSTSDEWRSARSACRWRRCRWRWWPRRSPTPAP